jgi:hypothetical protein
MDRSGGTTSTLAAPKYREFFALKRAVDPFAVFQNGLYRTYRPSVTP